MNQKNKKRAEQIFETSDFDTLHMNQKGSFFTSKNLALNSVKDTEEEKDRKIEEVSRDDVMKTDKKQEPPEGKSNKEDSGQSAKNET